MPPDSPGFEHRIECHCPNFSSRVCTFKISLYTTECVIPVYPRLVTSIIKWFESKTGTNLWSMSLELIKLVTRMKGLPQNVVLNFWFEFSEKDLNANLPFGVPMNSFIILLSLFNFARTVNLSLLIITITNH